MLLVMWHREFCMGGGSSPHFPRCSVHHLTTSQFKSNLVSVITTLQLLNTVSVLDAFYYKSCLTTQNVIGIQGSLQVQNVISKKQWSEYTCTSKSARCKHLTLLFKTLIKMIKNNQSRQKEHTICSLYFILSRSAEFRNKK